MSGLDLMRVPGLGLAAAMPSELVTEPRVERHLEEAAAPRTAFQLNRLNGVFRPTAREHAAVARVECPPASPSRKDLARA